MKTEKITLQKIVADDGMILTNGEIYGKEIFLSVDKNIEDFYEIAQEQYETLKNSIEEELEQ